MLPGRGESAPAAGSLRDAISEHGPRPVGLSRLRRVQARDLFELLTNLWMSPCFTCGMGKNVDGTLGWLRDRNRRRVLDVLREQGRASQAEIARATGLSRTTVSTLIAEMKDAGLVSDA